MFFIPAFVRIFLKAVEVSPRKGSRDGVADSCIAAPIFPVPGSGKTLPEHSSRSNEGILAMPANPEGSTCLGGQPRLSSQWHWVGTHHHGLFPAMLSGVKAEICIRLVGVLTLGLTVMSEIPGADGTCYGVVVGNEVLGALVQLRDKDFHVHYNPQPLSL